MIDMEVWEASRIEHGECLEAQVGPLQFWLRKSADEIHIAIKHQEDAESLTEAGGFDYGKPCFTKASQAGFT